MTVVATSPFAGKLVGENYTGPLEPWALAMGYAKRTDTSTQLASTGTLGVLVKDDPTLAVNREDVGVAVTNDTTGVLGGVKYSGSLAAPELAVTTPIAPATGLAAGGTVVTITGDNLVDVTGVTFGGVAGTNLVHVDDSTIKVTTPAHAAGAVTVVVTDPDGNATKTTGFTYS